MVNLNVPVVVQTSGRVDECASKPSRAMLLVFAASCWSAQQIWNNVSALLVYHVPFTIRSWDGINLPRKTVQRALLENVSTTHNALPPNFEGELSLFANRTPVTSDAAKALDERFEETAK